MPRAPRSTGPLPDDILDEIEALYTDGRFLRARALGEQHHPLHLWRGLRGVLLAGRLCSQLGDERRARALAALAWRQSPDSVAARAAYARVLMARGGVLAVWEFISRYPGVDGATAGERAEWRAAEAVALAMVRDFPNATRRIEQALADADDDAWIWVQRSYVFAAEDRHDDALSAARHGHALRPRYAAAIHAVVDALHRLSRPDEAIALLRESVPAMESFTLTRDLVALLLEREAYAEAQAHAARLLDLAPLLPATGVAHVHGLRSDIAYSLGDVATALDEARQAGPGFHATVAETLAAWRGPARRVRLAVPFVQQHFRTCGPATLTSLARFWGFEVDHQELARQIAYEGTWDHEERYWSETSLGCAVREFTVTWDAAVALLDRGVPFSLTTIAPTSGHLQAVIGYDARRGTLLVQDPYSGFVEYVRTFLDDQAASGPRGMVLVPKPEAGRLDGCLLPDAERWDALYRLKRALVVHDRDAAMREAEALAGHNDRLDIAARREIARYDEDFVAGLACVEALLVQFPDTEWLASHKYRYLLTLAGRHERLALVEAMTARPMCDPIWAQYAAEEYRPDARTWTPAERWARRALRRLPTEAGAYHVLAGMRAQQRRFDEACALARFAACLNPTDDSLSAWYLTYAAIAGRLEEALDLLRWRVRAYGAQSSRPAQTLFSALAQTYRFVEAFEALGTALETRPDDAELLLFAAQEYARDGDHRRAEALLERARPLTRPALWARAAAEIAMSRGDLDRSAALWREVVAAQPLDLGPHENLAGVLNQLEGREAAVAHLRAAAERWPHRLGIQQQYVEWLKAGDPDELRRVLQALVDTHPTFLWAHRELAWRCCQQGRLTEAAAAADAALALDPHGAPGHAIRGAVHAASGDRDAAAAEFREAIRLDVDNAFAIAELVANADTDARRRDALAFIRAELEQQTVFGPGLAGYREAARVVLSATEVLALCREALAARPDLLPAWTETIRQLLDVSDSAGALTLVDQALERFPVIADLYVLRAHAFLLAGDSDRRIEALTRARELAPLQIGHGVALGVALTEAGRLDDACRVLEETVRRAPADVGARLALAEALWRTTRRGEAIAAVEQAIARGVDDSGAWDRLRRWSLESGDPDRPLTLARRLTTDRPGDPRAWKALASVLAGDERLAALRRAVELAPRDEYARDILAEALADGGRFDEALAICEAPVFGSTPPLALRGRAAWLQAARGQRNDAISSIRRVLEERPSYAWGWLQLATWCAEEKDHEESLRAAGWLTRLLPGDASALAQLGRFQLDAGQRDAGKATLRRALELDAQLDWAAVMLIDALIDDKELDAAGDIVQRRLRSGEDQWLLLRLVRLAAAREDRAGVISSFERLCAAPAVASGVLEHAVATLVAAGHADAADAVFRRQLTARATPSAELARAYGVLEAERWYPGRDLDTFAAYVRQDSEGPAAVLAFLNRVIDRRAFEAAHILRRACRALFERDLDVWGEYARLLLETDQFGVVVDWMRDWRRRDGRRPWMLLNLAVALRALGHWSAAGLVHADADGLPADHATDAHRCWLALDDVLAGRLESARARLDSLRPTSGDSYYGVLRKLVVACLEGATDTTRGEVLLAAVATAHALQGSHALRRAYRRCRAFLLRRRGGAINGLRAWVFERLARTGAG